MRLLICAATVWMVAAGWAGAQQMENGIVVTGEATVSIAPDMARATLGVTETAATAEEAMSAVTKGVSAILDQLDQGGIAARDRQTSQFYLHPVYADTSDAPERQQTPEITGYRAGNSVVVTVRDLSALGATLDRVLAAGANEFNGLSFDVADSSEALAEARRRAVADAQLRAEQLADAAGLTLGTVLRVSESSNGMRPIQMEAAGGRGMLKSAIAQGEIDVSAQVTMVFAIAAAP